MGKQGAAPLKIGLAIGSRIRKSPYFDRLVELGMTSASVYNHMNSSDKVRSHEFSGVILYGSCDSLQVPTSSDSHETRLERPDGNRDRPGGDMAGDVPA
jgi:hypothetical protein